MKSKIVTLESIRIVESDGEKMLFNVPELLVIYENVINIFTKNETAVKIKNDTLIVGQLSFITSGQNDELYNSIIIKCTEGQAYRNIMKIKGVLEELKTMPDDETDEKDTGNNKNKIKI